MRQSELFTKTLREAPKKEKSLNAIFLQRAGFIHKEMAGVYTFLPLGLRVLRKIENIVREEVKAIAAQEVLMSVLQPKEIWEKTGRWSKGLGREVMYKSFNSPEGLKKGEIGLGPTHEEMITNIVKNYVKSYEDLPLYVFQVQTKFRREPRPRSGLLRGREFGMKDLYSFHSCEKDFKDYYEKVKKAYFKIFKRCGLEAVLTEASGAGFTQGFTHEFQVLSETGEDRIICCPKGDFARNKEISKVRAGGKCPVCGSILEEKKSIEVGNIFPLGKKYSEAMDAYFFDQQGRKKPIIMGCYGLGTSRLMGAVVEIFHDNKGIIWPEEIAPFKAHLLYLSSTKSEFAGKVKEAAETTYKFLKDKGISVLYDDRKGKSPGEKFADADLIGIPWRLVISEAVVKMKGNNVEIKKRDAEEMQVVSLNKAAEILMKQAV